jgi:alpha-beta hydrolase superfamily lysophospholipase
VAFDRRGFGQSQGQRGHVSSIAACVKEIHAVREQALLDRSPEDRPGVHLVGMSWGGLLAAYLALREPTPWASVTLIAPAIFTTRKPSRSQLAQASLKPWTKVDLPINTSDFSLFPEIRTKIENDPHRVTAVSLATLIHTIRLQLTVRSSWATKQRLKIAHHPEPLPMQLLLSNHDHLIDSDRTAKWARPLGIEVSWAQNAGHSLVLDCPEWTADQIATFVARMSKKSKDISMAGVHGQLQQTRRPA